MLPGPRHRGSLQCQAVVPSSDGELENALFCEPIPSCVFLNEGVGFFDVRQERADIIE